MAIDQDVFLLAESLAVGLQQPFAPSTCPLCFILFSDGIEPDSDKTLIMQTKAHGFWDALMAFVSSDWTAERQAAAATSLRRACKQCATCKLRPRRNARDFPPEPVFDLVYDVACTCLHSCLANRVGGQKKGFGSKRGRWPISAEQLFPHGGEQTMVSLVGLLDTLPKVEAVIVCLVSVHRPLAYPPLLKAATRARLITTMASRLTAVADAAQADLSKIRQPVLPAVRDAIAKRHISEAALSFLLPYVLAFGSDAKALDKMHIFYHREQELFKPVNAVVGLLEDPKRSHNYLVTLAGHLWHALSDVRRRELGCSEPPPYAKAAEELTEATLKDPYRALQFYLRQQTTRRDCHGPDCGKRVHDKATPGAFSRCAKCKAVQYCSRECQRAHWTGARFPHKEICDMLQELFTFARMDMKALEFSSACNARNFPLERVDRLIEWATNGYTSHDYAHGAPFLKKMLQPGTMGELLGIDPALKDKGLFLQVLPKEDGSMPTEDEVRYEFNKLANELEAGKVHDPDFTWK